MPEKQPFQKSVKQTFLGVINGVTIDDKLDYDHVDLILDMLYSHFKHPYITDKHFIRALYHAVHNFNQTLEPFENTNQIVNHVRELIEHKFEYTTFKEFRFCYNEQLKSCFDHVDEMIEIKA